jgi:peptide/nickel transport system permease protein
VRRRIPLLLGLVIVAFLFACAAMPELLSPYDPLVFDFAALQAPPSAAHVFGTDQFGRDVLARTISAARIDLTIAFCGVVFPLLIGAAIGLVTGWYGGWIDAAFGRLMDLVATFPFLVLVITFVAVLGPGLLNMFIALACVGWVSYARLMRGEVLDRKSVV